METKANEPEVRQGNTNDAAGVTKNKIPKTPRASKKKDPPLTVPHRPPIQFPMATFEVISRSSLPSWNEKENTSFGPRLGQVVLRRQTSAIEEDIISVKTPGMLCGASRGIVKHLSRDNVARATGVDWIHVPFEDFLELPTPVPTLHPAPLPLHAFLGHPRERHIISLCLRDPADNQNMPANTNGWVQTKTVRGVRKVAVTDWIKWCKDSRPDFIWAFVDVPKTLLGGEEGEAVPVGPGEGRQISQKRITKCIERSVGWIQTLLGTLVDRSTELNGIEGGLQASPDYRGLSTTRPPVIVSLLGGCDPRAREEFSLALVEKQDSIDVAKSGGLKRLDDGIFGYAVDMVDLPTNSLDATPTSKTEPLTELLRASLQHLPETKPRIAHTSSSPHAILRLISEHGFDLFDLPWVREAADLGVVLEYQFPPPRKLETERDERGMSGSLPIGSNLFEARFATDFGPLGIFDSKAASWPMAPTFEASRVLHSSLDRSQWEGDADATHGQPYTRAYVHHLLHTHEMSAYALLHLHNLAVSSRFFEDIQEYLSHHTVADFREEVIRFYQCYKLPDELFKGARLHWKEVELARGKGRLKREREAAASLV